MPRKSKCLFLSFSSITSLKAVWSLSLVGAWSTQYALPSCFLSAGNPSQTEPNSSLHDQTESATEPPPPPRPPYALLSPCRSRVRPCPLRLLLDRLRRLSQLLCRVYGGWSCPPHGPCRRYGPLLPNR